MHENLRWVEAPPLTYLQFRSVALVWIEQDGEWWVPVVNRKRRRPVRSKAQAMRWLEAWAAYNALQFPRPHVEVPGFGEI